MTRSSGVACYLGLVALVVGTVLLGACTAAPVITTTVTASPTASTTCTSSPVPSSTPVPTATATATITPSPTLRPTETPTDTSTPLPTETPTVTPTSTALPAVVRITEIQYRGSDEYVEISNQGGADRDLTGWTLASRGQKYPFRFPDGLVLPAGTTLRVHSGPAAGASSPWDLFWSDSYFWNNDGDEAILYDSGGQEIDRRGY